MVSSFSPAGLAQRSLFSGFGPGTHWVTHRCCLPSGRRQDGKLREGIAQRNAFWALWEQGAIGVPGSPCLHSIRFASQAVPSVLCPLGTAREQLSTSLLVFASQRPIYFASPTLSLRKFVYSECRVALLGKLGGASQQLQSRRGSPRPCPQEDSDVGFSPCAESCQWGRCWIWSHTHILCCHRPSKSSIFPLLRLFFAHSFVHTLYAGAVWGRTSWWQKAWALRSAHSSLQGMGSRADDYKIMCPILERYQQWPRGGSSSIYWGWQS